MASYEALIKKITTAEINRVQREGAFTRWAYFVDEAAGKAGVVAANDTTFAAYSVNDDPDPKLTEFGQEPISELVLTPDPAFLVVSAGENAFQAVLFTSPAVLVEDDFAEGFDYTLALNWQQFLQSRGVKLNKGSTGLSAKHIFMGAILVLIILFVLVAIVG